MFDGAVVNYPQVIYQVYGMIIEWSVSGTLVNELYAGRPRKYKIL